MPTEIQAPQEKIGNWWLEIGNGELGVVFCVNLQKNFHFGGFFRKMGEIIKVSF